MSATPKSNSYGFALESADSVRFGPEYTKEEVERNRQVLFGELLCGLLMGEPVWTNAVFAFDSRGMVEVLGAISRAFQRNSGGEQFLPFIISAYSSDKDPWQDNANRPWLNPAEVFLRCYAHRLKNPDFQCSATPELQQDHQLRMSLADKFADAANEGRVPELGDLTTNLQNHFEDLFSIDRYLRSWLGRRATSNFVEYAQKHNTHDMPIRPIRIDALNRYKRSPDSEKPSVSKLRHFLEESAAKIDELNTTSTLLAPAIETLNELLKLPHNHKAFDNRSKFRTELQTMNLNAESPTFRLLIELADGHYIRTQYTELSYAAREVTSPASKTEASQIGEQWASLTMQSCLSDLAHDRPWQFINRIRALPSERSIAIDLDKIARAFADFVSHPLRRGELATYHRLLAEAREVQTIDGGSNDTAKSRFEALQKHVVTCTTNINAHLSGLGVEFHFNVNDPASCAGSLTLTYQGNRSTSQCTGPQAIEIDRETENKSKSTSNEPPLEASCGSDNQLNIQSRR